jgi:protein SCO1
MVPFCILDRLVMKSGIILNVMYWIAVALLVAGCQKESGSVERREFTVNGVVTELPADGKTVVIQHEAIPNYMQAMTMPFDVHDPSLLTGLKAGDAVKFHLVVTDKDGWIDKIAILSNAPATKAPVNSGVTISRAVAPLDVGDTLPDGHFTNELGEPVQLDQYRGQVIAFTFFFTSCPYPNFCPRLTSNFGEVAAQLQHLTNAPAHWHLFSISFDPAIDTPQHLLSYATNAHYDPEHWSFLTGDPAQISELADYFGEIYSSNGTGPISHNLRTVVIDPRGRVRKIYEGNTWTPDELIQEMIKSSAR